MKPYTEMAISPPAMPNAMGSAAAGAIVAGGGEKEVRAAMGSALALATWGPAELTFGDGGSVKPMLHGSMPAGVGVSAARYAMAGMAGPRDLLECEGGLYATIGREIKAWAIEAPTFWHLEEPRRKLHAACGYIHSAIDLMGGLYRDYGPEMLATARAIRVFAPAYVLPAVLKTQPPTNPNNARFHLNYCVALAATGVNVILPEHSLDLTGWFTPQVASVMERIAVLDEPGFVHYSECRVEVERDDGSIITVSGAAPRGSPENPLGEEGVKAKFRSLVAGRIGNDDCERYMDRVMAIDGEASVEWLLGAFCPVS